MAGADSYDAVVVGATPAGLAASVRTAREGLETLLVARNDHLGGMWSSGIIYLTSYLEHDRTPFLAAFQAALRDHYADDAGAGDGERTGIHFEPHVAEGIFEDLVDAEDDLDVVRGHHTQAVERTARTVESITLHPFDDDRPAKAVGGDAFVDATYEGDLAATAGVPYRIGREPRAEHDEQFAGKIFMSRRHRDRPGTKLYNRDAIGRADTIVSPAELDAASADAPEALPKYRRGDLSLPPYRIGSEEILSGSTGEGDDAIQAYNYRVTLTDDPANRRRPEQPDGYDRSEYVDLSTASGLRVLYGDLEEIGFYDMFFLRRGPNDKWDMNAGDLPGENHAYPEADWAERERILERHRTYLLGLLYFLQNDRAVPDSIQAEARRFGLPADEFTDNDNFPFQIYVREARRIRGRETFTEQGVRKAPGLDRTPVHPASIAMTDFMIDCHGCNRETVSGSQWDGAIILSELTRPGQFGYPSIVPRGVDNLLVPVAASCSHVGYNAIRRAPTWANIAESAGFAVAMAAETGTTPADVDVDRLQRRLVEAGVFVSYVDELGTVGEDLLAALQYLSTKGFFPSYATDPRAPLADDTARVWAETVADLLAGADYDPTERARELADLDGRDGGPPAADGEPVSGATFRSMVAAACERAGASAAFERAVDAFAAIEDEELTRGDGALVAYELLGATAG